ncbi:MAG: hypothetical protein ACP5C3_09770 [Methanomicrobiales archaeon]
MTPRKKKTESALGKGLDALIKRDSEKREKKEIKSNSITSKIKESNLNNKLVEDVLFEVNKNPRISLWSARSAAVLRYLKKTKPEFSISSEASILIEEAVRDKYPDIWEIFEDL